MSSNNIGTDQEQGKFWAHMVVAVYFSIATYAVSKRDILGRSVDQSQFLSIFTRLHLDVLVPASFWRGAHCKITGVSLYEDDEDESQGRTDSGSMITVTVAEPTGLVHSIEIDQSATVEELKEQLCADTVASPQRLQLAWDGQVLEEEYLSLKQYNLLTGSHLEAVMKVNSVVATSTRPASPVLEVDEQNEAKEDPSSTGLAILTTVTRPASPNLPITKDGSSENATARAAQPEPEVAPIDALKPVALPPRPGLPAIGISRAASPTRADRPLQLAENLRGGGEALHSGKSPSSTLSLMAAEPFAQSPVDGTQTATPPRGNLRLTGFELGYHPDYSPSNTLSFRRRGRDAMVERKETSPARNALMIRRISTKFEHVEDPTRKKGWLRNTLWQVFHRPEKWKVKDILVYRTGKHGLACFGSHECFECHECTAFIVFESPEMPLDIIRRHRDATQKAWLTVLLQPLKSICSFCMFVCCPNLPCLRTASSSPRSGANAQRVMGLETIFGRNRDTDRLGMPQWELQPGPTKEDLIARADSQGRWKNLNRPRWQKHVTTWFGNAVLVVLSSVMIFWSTLLEAVMDGYNSDNHTKFWNIDPDTGNLEWDGSSKGSDFFGKYIPTFISFCIIVGVLPTLIDIVVYFVEPHFLMSDVYRSVLNKNLLLLLISSLILPSLALTRLNDIKKEEALFESQWDGVKETIQYGHNQNDVCRDDPAGDGSSQSLWVVLWRFISYPVRILINGFGNAFGGEVAGYFFRYMTHTTLLGVGATLLLMPDKFYRTVSCVFRRKNERKVVWEFPLE